VEVLCCVKVCETPPRVGGALSFSQEIATTRLRMGNKNSVPKRETHKKIDTSSTIPLESPVGII
jgi:hypothetical protein